MLDDDIWIKKNIDCEKKAKYKNKTIIMNNDLWWGVH
jgi:hypothetical protein